MPDRMLLDSCLSVAGLTVYVKELLETDRQLQYVWVTGEVGEANQARSGHLYFTLKDPKFEATVKCAVWNSQRDKLAAAVARGKQLLVRGSISLYPPQGEYKLIVDRAIDAGEGLLALRLRQMRSRLEAEGLFDSERKRALPPHPQTVAVVTSPNAAAWGDIQRTLKQRYPGLHVLLSPATVQGEEAPDSIAAAIDRVDRDGRAEVLILARGGGAVDDLGCFNDERVVRAIANCSIPVITGIGHQRDESLADLAADFCAHTPTAAAERAVPELASLYAEHRQRVLAVREAAIEQYKIAASALLSLRKQLVQQVEDRLLQETFRCQQLRQKLDALHPEALLKRGYALVQRADGAIARSTDGLTPGQELFIHLGQGKIKVKITEIVGRDVP